MTELVLELKAKVLSLSAAERSELLDLLVRSLDDDEHADAWVDEALRREADVKAGRIGMVDAEAALLRVEASLR